MEILARLLVAVADFFEAEGRTLKAGVAGIATMVGLILLAIALVVTGAVLVLWALYLLLAWALNPAAAGLIIGGIALLLGIVILLLARHKR